MNNSPPPPFISVDYLSLIYAHSDLNISQFRNIGVFPFIVLCSEALESKELSWEYSDRGCVLHAASMAEGGFVGVKWEDWTIFLLNCDLLRFHHVVSRMFYFIERGMKPILGAQGNIKITCLYTLWG